MNAQSIIERYKRYGWSTPPGEWGAIQSSARAPLREAIEDGEETLDRALAVMFQLPICNGLSTFDSRHGDWPNKVDLFRDDVAMNLRTWMCSTDATLADLERLLAPEAGSPFVCEVEGVRIMYDTARHDHYAQKIVKLLPDGGTVLEIGGGYGGMALQLLRSSDNIQVVLCDLPETLYLAWYWLTNATERSVAWYDDDPDADVVLLPAQELEAWTRTPDLVFAAHSLSEFTLPVVKHYVGWIHRVRPRYFYHDSAHSGHMQAPAVAGSANSCDQWPEVMVADINPSPPYHEVYRAQGLWRGTGLRYWEFLYERR